MARIFECVLDNLPQTSSVALLISREPFLLYETVELEYVEIGECIT